MQCPIQKKTRIVELICRIFKKLVGVNTHREGGEETIALLYVDGKVAMLIIQKSCATFIQPMVGLYNSPSVLYLLSYATLSVSNFHCSSSHMECS